MASAATCSSSVAAAAATLSAAGALKLSTSSQLSAVSPLRRPTSAIAQCRPQPVFAVRAQAQENAAPSRRVLVGTAAAAVALLALNPTGSAEAARRKPPTEEPKKKKREDNDLSGYQAKVLENMKRKEALKAKIAATREKAGVSS